MVAVVIGYWLLPRVRAFAAIVILGTIGVWLATSITDMRKNQDCVLSGRRDCAVSLTQPR